MKRIDKVEQWLRKLCVEQRRNCAELRGIAADEIAAKLNIHRSNVSADLNALFRAGRIEKSAGKPVLFSSRAGVRNEEDGCGFRNVIGGAHSLKNAVQQARAAIMYPPKGLHTLLYGETGTGKSLFATAMYEYAREIKRIDPQAPYIVFNCADYANNPELLMAQLFGVRKGAYTGAERDRCGLVEKAHRGVLFLDEVHRLSPEGQEMLFYLIDRGAYRKLGEVEAEQRADVMIICATTEAIDSTLLRTFTRRIPMLIKLPPLRERSLEERQALIANCFQNEAACIQEEISVTATALSALLLYDCVNNIGQLQSDIKLCCAKAFMESRMKETAGICIHSEDLPPHTVRGLLRRKERKGELDALLTAELVVFSGESTGRPSCEAPTAFTFYEALEEKRRVLELKGVDKKDIALIMSLDIDVYFKKYMLNIANRDREDLYKVVDKSIVDLVEEFLQYAATCLDKQLDAKILCGLALHLSKSLERIKSGAIIENQRLDEIKTAYRAEYEVAQVLGRRLEKAAGVTIPEAEIGFMAMFLGLDRAEAHKGGRTAVIVAMHGETAATSLADVANRLLGETHAKGYNLLLDQKTETALEELAELVEESQQGQGALLLVDMGSLALVGDMVYERTQIPVKTIEMVSTPMVIEATRKAMLYHTLDEIYDACLRISPFALRVERAKEALLPVRGIKNNVLITTCITGQGTAVKLQTLLTQKLDSAHGDVDVLALEGGDRQMLQKNLQRIKTEKHILAVIGAVAPDDPELLYLPLPYILAEDGMAWLNRQMAVLKSINNMESVIAEHVSIDQVPFSRGFRQFYVGLLEETRELNDHTAIGMMLHLAYAVERIKNGAEMRKGPGYEEICGQHGDKVSAVKRRLAGLEQLLAIDVPQTECVNLAKMIFFL